MKLKYVLIVLAIFFGSILYVNSKVKNNMEACQRKGGVYHDFVRGRGICLKADSMIEY